MRPGFDSFKTLSWQNREPESLASICQQLCRWRCYLCMVSGCRGSWSTAYENRATGLLGLANQSQRSSRLEDYWLKQYGLFLSLSRILRFSRAPHTSREEVLSWIGLDHGVMASSSALMWRCRYLGNETNIRNSSVEACSEKPFGNGVCGRVKQRVLGVWVSFIMLMMNWSSIMFRIPCIFLFHEHTRSYLLVWLFIYIQNYSPLLNSILKLILITTCA